MTFDFPLRQRLGLLAFVLASLAVAFTFVAKTGGPGVPHDPPLRLDVTLDDVQGVARQADVLVRGVKVGEVDAVTPAARGGTRLTLAITRSAGVLHADASAGMGSKTPLGEAFVDLDPGRRGAPPRNGAAIRARPAVEIDEALGVLDRSARADTTTLLKTAGRGLRSPRAAARLSSTLQALDEATRQAQRVGRALRGQEATLAGAVQASRRVLTTLAARGPRLRGLVTDARATLRTTARRRAQLGQVMAQLPSLLREADGTLRQAAPLAREATPLAQDLQRAAGPLRAGLAPLPGTLQDARALIDRAPALRRAAAPALKTAAPALRAATPVVRRLGPLMANLVPIARFLGPRGNTAAAWFANTADLGSNGDAKGRWARFFVLFDPSTVLGVRGGDPPGNSYTPPDDAAANRPYRAGGYPRLSPFGAALEP